MLISRGLCVSVCFMFVGVSVRSWGPVSSIVSLLLGSPSVIDALSIGVYKCWSVCVSSWLLVLFVTLPVDVFVGDGKVISGVSV